MQIHGLQKTTLLDYPGKVAATVFFGGCNFRCPFCHNMNLVLHPESESCISEQDVFTFLRSRVNILDGVCITGGEPTLQAELLPFIYKIKSLGFLVKLDTNGSSPLVLKELVHNSLLDYVAMDIKSSEAFYSSVCGLSSFDYTSIKESISFLLENSVPYEFRTTVIFEYHNSSVFHDIGYQIQGAENYYLQAFQDSDYVMDHSLHACSKEMMLQYKKLLTPYVKHVSLRGID